MASGGFFHSSRGTGRPVDEADNSELAYNNEAGNGRQEPTQGGFSGGFGSGGFQSGNQQFAHHEESDITETQGGFSRNEAREQSRQQDAEEGRVNNLFTSQAEHRGIVQLSDDNRLNDHHVPAWGHPNFTKKCFTEGFQIGSAIGTTLVFMGLVGISIVVYAFCSFNPLYKWGPLHKPDPEWERRISGERFSGRTAYYIEYWGYQAEEHEVETEDGFVLKVFHIISKKHKRRGPPVLLQHGILSNSNTWVVNEERSLAFWLLERGYDVWLGNVRTNFKMRHREFGRSDPRYWAWAIKEIGCYDNTAMISYIYEHAGRRKVHYIGHSQGTGTMFLALSKGMRPEIGRKMASFVALGPSVYSGPVLQQFPITFIRIFTYKNWLWELAFGVREFVPALSFFATWIPAWLFGHIALPVFWFIFGFSDHYWVPRQLPKLFRAAPCANSAELLKYYMMNFAVTHCIFDDSTNDPWFTSNDFPPLLIAYGTADTLVLGAPLVEHIERFEPKVPLRKVVCLDHYEHLDLCWAVHAPDELWVPTLQFLKEAEGRA